VPTVDDEAYLLSNLHVPLTRISRVDNGAPRLALPERTVRSHGRLRLLFYGSWIDRKGATDLVAAISSLAATTIDFTVTLAGGGRSTQEVISDFPFPARQRISVRQAISRSELPRLLFDHDILISASWFEGMPLTVLEAAAAGLALILTDISGHRQILAAASDNMRTRSAILVQPHRPQEIVDAVTKLAKDRDLCIELGMNARSIARVLSWDNVGVQLEHAYLRAMSGSSTDR
jgi:glycosyltransferase involved in cell wall biosynthesis